MNFNVTKELIRLIKTSQTTVLKLFQFVNGTSKQITKSEFEKFQNNLIKSLKSGKQNALDLFPIIKYLEEKNLSDDDYGYDNVLFTVRTEDRIAIASPIASLTSVPDPTEYDLKVEWDLVKIDELETRNYSAMMNYFDLIKDDENIRKFVEYIGTNLEEELELKEIEEELFIENVPQEVFALYQSDDLNNLLPHEIVQLDDPDLELIFLKNLVEKKLLSYQLSGIERQMREAWVVDYKEVGKKGPILVCLDTSGSMRDLNEIVAKAFALTVINILEKLGVNCAFFPFSMDAKFYDLFNTGNKTKLVANALKTSFYGGSDITNLISLLKTTIFQRKYQNVNILIISDFLFKNVNNEEVNKLIKDIKAAGHRFHAVNISENKYKNGFLEHFETEWAYYYNWTQSYHKNKDRLINELASNEYTATFSNNREVNTFGIIKRLKDTEMFVSKEEKLAKLNEQLRIKNEKYNR